METADRSQTDESYFYDTAKKMLAAEAEYARRAMEPLLDEKTAALGNRLLLLSIFLVLIFADVFTISKGTFLGVDISVQDSQKNMVFAVICLGMLYFTLVYFFEFRYRIFLWKSLNSEGKTKLRELSKTLVTIFEKNKADWLQAVDNASFSERESRMLTTDKALDNFKNERDKRIRRRFRFQVLVAAMPIFFSLLALAFALRYLFL